MSRTLEYEFQMQYGSIGWSFGATLGYAQAVPEKRVLAFIGDGSFQVTMWSEDHHLPDQLWWIQLIQVFCEEELVNAIETATGPKTDCLCFIEVTVHKDDTSKELLEWGTRQYDTRKHLNFWDQSP
ncbi:pyruvate decarboxylase 2-like [Silene latifolia]|uniref:pyruvate decarboxylase 2-like n=1 Tax=Silene latifolia TaxID=37657 RepID=UPI003D785197